ncbi:MAG: PEP/pyruvate-binding domain-containing protein [Lachnospiraceae bacterium]|nr:PEP/pyruvate-binding domain-containing protein [Lachnospiraceae bacterium]
MAAFEKVKSGLSGLDRILDNIRLGDNVVWQVTDLSEYHFFVEPYIRQAIEDQRNLVYIRFAQHPPIFPLPEEPELSKDCEVSCILPEGGIHVYRFDPEVGFEQFTVAIHDVITKEGRDAFYVFDSLSELQSAWYTDLMMGNFFCVTCPYLFILDTVAFFPLIRGRHSFDAVARIRETTQLLLDVHSDGSAIYVHPLKVWKRYSSTMFLPHFCSGTDDNFEPLTDPVEASRYYSLIKSSSTFKQEQSYDSYDRFFSKAKADYQAGYFTKNTESMIIESMMSRDPKMQELIHQFFEAEDYFTLRDRMIGSGAIGGKACGMLLARKIVEKKLDGYHKHAEQHDSFYIGSDIFYTYIVSNGCWNLRIAQRTSEGYMEKAGELKEGLLHGKFSAATREQFRNMLEYYGQNPIIVRSSSLLEDGFGNAFAGKYESVFCPNRGEIEERMEAFENAVRIVYASTMDPSALEYRRSRGLDHKDEQMAILVQRVSGAYYGPYFMPCTAGVGYSYSAYKWMPDMDPSAGMLRIVMGLGTKAVDRTENDYPRLVNLDRPEVTMLTNVADKHRFSQHKIDVINMEKNQVEEVSLSTLVPYMPRWYKNTVLEHDTEAEDRLREAGRYRDVFFVSCQQLLANRKFTSMMKKTLHELQEAYGNPVDIEYTVNLSKENDFVVNLLQCRPLYVGKDGGKIQMPDVLPEKVFFEIRESSMGQSCVRPIDVVIQVEPKEYYEFEHVKKPLVAEAIGAVNQYYKGKGRHILLTVPGRIGTSSPELGVPVRFVDISGVDAICEVTDNRAGYMPELSYGSHMFQDLVEADIFYGAIFGDRRTISYQRDFFEGQPNLFPQICPDCAELSSIVRVYEAEDMKLWVDGIQNHVICAIQH